MPSTNEGFSYLHLQWNLNPRNSGFRQEPTSNAWFYSGLHALFLQLGLLKSSSLLILNPSYKISSTTVVMSLTNNYWCNGRTTTTVNENIQENNPSMMQKSFFLSSSFAPSIPNTSSHRASWGSSTLTAVSSSSTWSPIEISIALHINNKTLLLSLSCPYCSHFSMDNFGKTTTLQQLSLFQRVNI